MHAQLTTADLARATEFLTSVTGAGSDKAMGAHRGDRNPSGHLLGQIRDDTLTLTVATADGLRATANLAIAAGEAGALVTELRPVHRWASRLAHYGSENGDQALTSITWDRPESESNDAGDSTGDDTELRLRCHEAEARLRTLPADEFPEADARNWTGWSEVGLAQFAGALRITALSMPDENDPSLFQGVHMQQGIARGRAHGDDGAETQPDAIELATTDSLWLSLARIGGATPGPATEALLIPGNAARALAAALPKETTAAGRMTIETSETRLRFRWGDNGLECARPDASGYPGLGKVLRVDTGESFELDIPEYAATVELVSAIAKPKIRDQLEHRPSPDGTVLELTLAARHPTAESGRGRIGDSAQPVAVGRGPGPCATFSCECQRIIELVKTLRGKKIKATLLSHMDACRFDDVFPELGMTIVHVGWVKKPKENASPGENTTAETGPSAVND